MCLPTAPQEAERDSLRLNIDPGSSSQALDQMVQGGNGRLMLSAFEARYSRLLPPE
jgi:hypothetical protein